MNDRPVSRQSNKPLSDPPRNTVPAWMVVVGGVPLLLVMLIEFITVVGRNTGFIILGSIELVQAAILLSSASAIVMATLSRSHAKVRILLNRSSGKTAQFLKVFNALGGMLFFLALTIGGVWIALDMWDAQEHSELLRVPYLPLRVFAAVCTLTTAGLYLRRMFVRGPD
ncbi:MAG TPA: TRAP transporter small permease subunit [Xanthomonadales bacterium]|nr:TRAP transporter small permease subunit [Xanthomonadales bacterium]